MSKRILILANFGMGLYKFRKELLSEFINNQYEVIVSFPHDEYVSKIVNIGCEYIETKVDRRGTNILNDLKLFLTYLRIIRSYKPDIVLTYTVKPNIYGGIACRLLNVRFIPNVTGLGTALEEEGTLQKVILLLYKLSFKRAKYVFFQNKANEDFFIKSKIIHENSYVLHGSGVNIEEYHYQDYPTSSETIRFTFIGRIMKAKGIEEYLKAAEIIKSEFSNTEFHIIGFCEEDYIEILYNHHRDKLIIFHGQLENVKNEIVQSHAIVLPSHHEGLSNVLLESASSGRPIIASNIPGCLETFDEGVSGYGFEVKNVSSLVSAIKKFILLPHNKKNQMGKEGRLKIEREFNRKDIVDKYINEINT